MKHRISFVWIALFAALLLPRPAARGVSFDGDRAGHRRRRRRHRTRRPCSSRCGPPVRTCVGGNVRLVVRDAAGANPVTLSTFPAPNPTNGAAAARSCSTTAVSTAKTTPAATGRLHDDRDPGELSRRGLAHLRDGARQRVYWRVSWGGARTRARTAVDLTNLGDERRRDSSPAFGGVAALGRRAGAALHARPAAPRARTTPPSTH